MVSTTPNWNEIDVTDFVKEGKINAFWLKSTYTWMEREDFAATEFNPGYKPYLELTFSSVREP